jgi:hypothetical protein
LGTFPSTISQGCAPERENGNNNQYVIFAMHSTLQQIEKLYNDLALEFEEFKARHPEVCFSKEQYYEPFG